MCGGCRRSLAQGRAAALCASTACIAALATTSPLLGGFPRSSMVSLYGNDSSAKAINYSALAKQASHALQGARKGNYSGCVPLLKVRAAAGGGRGARLRCGRQLARARRMLLHRTSPTPLLLCFD